MSIMIKSGLSFLRGLPVGYTPLDYIESIDGQYINTGFSPNQNTRVVCDFQFTALPTTTDYHLGVFGARVGVNADDKSFVFAYRDYTNSNSNFRSDYNTTRTMFNVDSSLILNRYVVDKNKNVTILNGEFVNETVTASFGTFNINNIPLYLFGINTNNDSGGNKFRLRIYSCQIYDNGTIVRDFKPCVNPEGKIGMYNTINSVFYPNAGTGEFIPGHNYTVNNYVNDSINLWLDGVWNNGAGLHNNSLTAWKDLSGNCKPTPLGSGNRVSFNCITSDGTESGRMTVPDTTPINLNTFTLEVLCRKNSGITGNQVIIGRNYTRSYYINTAYHNLNSWLGYKTGEILSGGHFTQGNKYLLQLTHTGSKWSAWVNGQKVVSDKGNTLLTDSAKLNLFGYSGNKTTFDGSIFAVRLHRRVLTEKELMKNYKIDKVRFGVVDTNITSTASTMMLETDDETSLIDENNDGGVE